MTSIAVAFEDAYGHAPTGVWSAPGRVNLIGEHTDYNHGYVLPFAIDRRTWAAVGTRDDRTLRLRSTFADAEVTASLDALSPEGMDGWSAYVLGVAWAMGEAGIDLSHATGLDILIDSEVPVGAGLSSSAALECAVGQAFSDLWGLDLDALSLARIGRVAENRAVGAPTGLLDQAASMLGREDHAVFLDCDTEQARPVALHLREESLQILVMNSHVDHEHATGGYGARFASCERGARTLGVTTLREVTPEGLDDARAQLDEETFRRVRHVVTENQRVLDTVAALSAKGPRAIGELMNASQASMRDDFEITVPEIDLACDTAVAHGAVGARMTGGGFGGSAIAVVPASAADDIAAAVTSALALAGLREPTIFTVVPSQGARRDS
ncbi:galactokinase [Demequina activiva]|uniref:Galactokinase n=1 Tax=Demequina activiva TaxID=1582364 RepID=A0A919Q433_9MICO|nr:galactokinase [Demequina activiva]GIG53928.1 galactokinase [Demequina activiva]